MVIYLYRWQLKPGYEQQFQENWSIVTQLLRDQGGSFGSRLHQADNGEWIGYAQWPSMEARETCTIASPKLERALALMREAIAESAPAQVLQIKEDFLVLPTQTSG